MERKFQANTPARSEAQGNQMNETPPSTSVHDSLVTKRTIPVPIHSSPAQSTPPNFSDTPAARLTARKPLVYLKTKEVLVFDFPHLTWRSYPLLSHSFLCREAVRLGWGETILLWDQSLSC